MLVFVFVFEFEFEFVLGGLEWLECVELFAVMRSLMEELDEEMS